MTKLVNPIPIFLDGRGDLLDGGYIYVGEAGADPEQPENQIECFWDAEQTVAAAQPFRTLGGIITNGGNAGFVFFADADYAVVVRDSNGVLVSSVPSVLQSGAEDVEYQPLDGDLTAIASAGSTAYGRGLLGLTDQVALKLATGIPTPLPAIGGTVSGPITRAGAGVHAYFADAAMTGGRIFITAAGAADPTSQPGDLWFTY